MHGRTLLSALLPLLLLSTCASAGGCALLCPGNLVCANSYSECGCITNATRPQVTISSSVTVIDATQAVSINAVASYTAPAGDCRSVDLSLFLSFKWTILEDGSSFNAQGAVFSGASASFPPNCFRAGHTYTFSVSVLTVEQITVVHSAHLPCSAPPATVSISQFGSFRRCGPHFVPITAVIVDTTIEVSEVTWTCVVAGSGAACPTQITSVLVTGQTVIDVVGPVPAGTYHISCHYKQKVDTCVVEVAPKPVPSCQLVFDQSTGISGHYFHTETVRVTSAVSFNSSVTYAWTLNGNQIGTNVSLAFNASLLAVGSNNVTLTVVDATDATASGLCSITVVGFEAVTASLTVVGESTAIVAGTDKVNLTCSSNALQIIGNLSAQVTFQFGFIEQGQMTYLRPFPQAPNAMTAVCPTPFSSAAGSVEVEFFVIVMVGSVAVMTTTQSVQATIPNHHPSTFTDLHDRLFLARDTDDIDSCISLSLTIVALLNLATSSSAGNAPLPANATLNEEIVVSIVTVLNTVVGSRTSTMNSNRRGQVIQVLDRLIFLDLFFDNGMFLSTMKSTLGASVLTQSDFDVQAYGGTALGVLGRLDHSDDVVQLCRSVSESFALVAAFGEILTVQSQNVSIASTRNCGANIGGTNLLTGSNTLFVPSNATFTSVQTTSLVSVSSVTFNEVPVATSFRAQSKVSDFSLLVDGQRQSVSNLKQPLRLRLPAQNPSQCQCMYYNEGSQRWATDGVRTVSRDNDGIDCETDHLTMFGAFDQSAPSAQLNTGITVQTSSASYLAAAAAVVVSLLALCA